eukprot:2434683-Prymnesium_polylepis.1
MEVMKDPVLRTLKYQQLYERSSETAPNTDPIGQFPLRSLFDQYSDKINPQHFYNGLLLAAIVQTIAVDTSICER